MLDYLTEAKTDGEPARRTTYGLSMPLRSMQVGEYSLEFEVYDQILDQRVSRKASFQVY